MLKQALIVLGVLLAFGCADVPDENKQLASCGCSDCSDPIPENQYVTPKDDNSGSGGSSDDGGTTGGDSGSTTPSDTTAPTISTTSPSSGANSVSISSNISINFSEEMDSSTINSTNITVQDSSGNSVSGLVSYSSQVATFNPNSDLNYFTVYTVMVGTGVKDGAGNTMAASNSWSFTTTSAPDTTTPTISSPSTSGATDVSVSADITVPFSEEMDSSTINSTNITVVDGSGNPVNGIWTYSGTTATFNPSSDLSYSTTYTVTVGTGVKDRAGNALGSVLSWNFTTIANWQGTQQIGTTAVDVGHGISLDSLGNIYVAGYTEGDLDSNSNAGGMDIFLLKYNSSGVKQWSRHMGTASNDYAYGIAVDQSDNIYITGTTDGGSLDGNPNLGSNDVFLAKFNSVGNQQWIKQFGTTAGDRGYDVTVGASGHIYISGSTSGALNGESHTGQQDAFVVKFNSDGSQEWTWQLGTASSDLAHDVVTDSSDNVYVSIESRGNFDGNSNAGQGDLFLVKLSSSGVKQWSRSLGTSENDYAWEITTDATNHIYITGATVGGLDSNFHLGGNDLILVKYDSNGAKQWTKQIGTAKDDVGQGIITDNLGNIYVTGSTWGTIGSTANKGEGDILTIKFNNDGEVQWTQQIGTSLYDEGMSISRDSSGNLFVTGFTKEGLDGNSGVGLEDVFVLKYDGAGNLK